MHERYKTAAAYSALSRVLIAYATLELPADAEAMARDVVVVRNMLLVVVELLGKERTQ